MLKWPARFLGLLAVPVALVACGNPPIGVLSPNNMTGAAALAKIQEATNTGLVVCLTRTGGLGSLPSRIQFDTVIASFQDIDMGRAYSKHDVESCASTLQLAISFDPNCSYLAWNCRLRPVNKLTGAH